MVLRWKWLYDERGGRTTKGLCIGAMYRIPQHIRELHNNFRCYPLWSCCFDPSGSNGCSR